MLIIEPIWNRNGIDEIRITSKDSHIPQLFTMRLDNVAIFLPPRPEVVSRATCLYFPTGHWQEHTRLSPVEPEGPARKFFFYILTCVFATQKTDKHVHSTEPVSFQYTEHGFRVK